MGRGLNVAGAWACRPWRLASLSVFLVVLVGLAPSVAQPAPDAVANPFLTSSRSAKVFLVPLDGHARQLLGAVKPALATWLPPGIAITSIPTPGAKWQNAARGGQRDAGAISDDLLARFRRAQGGRSVLLMAVTSESVYSPQIPEVSFVFGFYGFRERQAAAVLGTRPMRVVQPDRERARLTKMMLRYIGEIVCGLPRNTNPRSVLYSPLIGTPDLDRMVATLPARCRL